MKRHTQRERGSTTNKCSNPAGKSRWHLLSLLALIIAILTALVWGPSFVDLFAGPTESAIAPSSAVQQIPGWRVGMLRRDGLRIIQSGVSDAPHVLSSAQFSDKAVTHAY